MTICPKCRRVLSGSILDDFEPVEFGMPCDDCARVSGLSTFFGGVESLDERCEDLLPKLVKDDGTRPPQLRE
jgi:hypothetical protein